MLDEAESDTLQTWLTDDGNAPVGSELLVVEVLRASRKVNPRGLGSARTMLRGVRLLPLTRGLLEEAAELGPSGLRSLDAIHLASALSIRDDLTAFVAYDRRLLDAARDRGLPVVSPGA